MIYSSFGDPKKMPKSMQAWWPIEGDVVTKIKIPSKAKLLKYEQLFKQLGKKNG